MNEAFFEYIHPRHFDIFVEAASKFQCHILVRKTGKESIKRIGIPGFTGKRADMKAKTADRSVPPYDVAGLVCSPFLQPGAFSSKRIGDATKKWVETSHLVTVPPDSKGFDDDHQLSGCYTPYVLQNNPKHKRYGCVALIDCGLLVPRYIHGDYDLYAIIPAGKSFDFNKLDVKERRIGSTMAPRHLTLEERFDTGDKFSMVRNPETKVWEANINKVSGLSDSVADFINIRIGRASSDWLGALMVNHGEQINDKPDYQEVLAVMPRQENGEWAKIIAAGADNHKAFYRNA